MDRKEINIVDYYYDEIVGHMIEDDIKSLVAHLVRMLVLTEFSSNVHRRGKVVKIVDVCAKTQEK